jgi:hypothetical protein
MRHRDGVEAPVADDGDAEMRAVHAERGQLALQQDAVGHAGAHERAERDLFRQPAACDV